MDALDRVSLKIEYTSGSTWGSPSSSDEEEEDEAFGDVQANIFLDGKAESIGIIRATLVDRQRIADGCFHFTFDEHSSNMEWIGCTLLEDRRGRTVLESLRRLDDPECAFMYIASFWVNHDSSDVAAAALYKFLRDPNLGSRVTSAAYVLPAWASSTGEAKSAAEQSNDRKRKRHAGKTQARHFAEAFLRNGFFQDQALIRKDRDNARILVASHGHWNRNIRSSTEIAATRLISHVVPKPSGKDLEILEAVESMLSTSFEDRMMNLSAVMAGRATYEPPRDNTTTQQLNDLRKQIQAMRNGGGSIARSTALHAACEKNCYKVVQLLLEIEPAAIEAKDSMDRTPLMTAAIKAFGRCSINGLDDTKAIDHLLAAGANKSSTDPVGMTAYGYFRKSSKLSFDIVRFDKRGTLTSLENKLLPPGGPTTVDLADGKGVGTGFVDYGPEDDEADREMGRGRYASDYEDDEDGDY